MKKSLLIIIGCSIPLISSAYNNSWTGMSFGLSGSVIETAISNAKLNAFGFTTAAFGLEAGYRHQIDNALVLGLAADLNFSPFIKSARKEREFSMRNRTPIFGSLLLELGASISNSMLVYGNFGIGAMYTATDLQTVDDRKYSDHSSYAVNPVIGGGIKYKAPNNVYAAFSVNYYISTSFRYYSTVAESNATLRKGLTQGKLSVGYYFS